MAPILLLLPSKKFPSFLATWSFYLIKPKQFSQVTKYLSRRWIMAGEKITVSVIKADIGGYVGHSSIHEALLEKAEKCLKGAKGNGLITDYRVLRCGDDLELIMTHKKGEEN